MYKPNLEKLNKKLKSLGSNKFLKLQEGDNKIRFLPPVNKEGEFYVEQTLHHGFNDGNRDRAYPCLEAMRGKTCPICIFYRKAIEEGEKDVAKKVEPKTTFMSNVVDRSDGNIKIYTYNQKLLKAILGYLVDDEYGPEILDPKNGRDFTIKRDGQGFKTRYGDPRISPKPRPVGVEDWEEKAHNIEGEMEFKSFDDMVDLLESEYNDWIEEWGLDFTKKKSKAKVEEVEEEEDEDDGDDEETKEEQDEAPRRSKVGSKSKSKSDEDDHEPENEDSEDDDEEDSAPAKKSGAKSGTSKAVTKGKSKSEPEEIEDDDDLEAFLADDDDDEVEIEDEAPKKSKVKGKKK